VPSVGDVGASLQRIASLWQEQPARAARGPPPGLTAGAAGRGPPPGL